MVSHGPVELLSNKALFTERNRRMPLHETAWFKTLMPAPVGDILASVDQRRQLQLSVEGVSVSVLSTFKLGAQQQRSAVDQLDHKDSGAPTSPLRRRRRDEPQQVFRILLPCLNTVLCKPKSLTEAESC
jgi:hypothetical protein